MERRQPWCSGHWCCGSVIFCHRCAFGSFGDDTHWRCGYIGLCRLCHFAYIDADAALLLILRCISCCSCLRCICCSCCFPFFPPSPGPFRRARSHLTAQSRSAFGQACRALLVAVGAAVGTDTRGRVIGCARVRATSNTERPTHNCRQAAPTVAGMRARSSRTCDAQAGRSSLAGRRQGYVRIQCSQGPTMPGNIATSGNETIAPSHHCTNHAMLHLMNM
jgi:hypothetical protein